MGYTLALWLGVSLITGNVKKLPEIHSHLMSRHTYITDTEQYGVADKWRMSLTGDCEDFAVFSYFYLIGKGYTPQFWLVRTKLGDMHAVLLINDYVFDNIKLNRLDESDYTLIVEMSADAVRKAIKQKTLR